MFTLKSSFNFVKKSLVNGVNYNKGALPIGARNLQLFRRPNESKKDDEELEELEPSGYVEFFDEEEEDPVERQQRIDRIRNKSRLRTQHRNIINDQLPYEEPQSWIHNTLKYKRAMYGRYGKNSNVDPRICFETSTELQEKREYERVAFPKTIQEMIAICEKEKIEKQQQTQEREAQIAKNLQKLNQWMTDLENKKNKKETEARLAKERKDRLIEEVRRHFGYTIHHKDDRFKELLEKKEKEQRKALKETKRQEKEAKLLAKLATDSTAASKTEENKPREEK